MIARLVRGALALGAAGAASNAARALERQKANRRAVEDRLAAMPAGTPAQDAA